jgi:VWFA-related protein
MIPARSRGIICVATSAMAASVVWLHAQTPPAQQVPPTFIANTDVVLVDVSVRRNGAQVPGLTAADFDLRDNGVKQDIETVESTAVPIDLSIVVDVSGNPDRPWANLPSPSKVAAEMDAEVRKLVALLRPGDRVRLFAQDTYVQQIWSLQPASSAPRVERVAFDGQSSLFDTLTTVLLQPIEPRRRHVIVAATKGLDTISAVSAADVSAIADHADAQLHLVMLEMDADKEAGVQRFQCACMDLCRSTRRFWVPARRRLFVVQPVDPPPCGLPPLRLQPGPSTDDDDGLGLEQAPSAPLHNLLLDGEFLQRGAEATGGQLYRGQMLAEPTLFGTFRKAFDNFRQSYVLRYSPKGVARPGWHQITVTVPKDKSLKVQSRTGYHVDVPVAASARAARPAGAVAPRLETMADLMDAYDRGEYRPVEAVLDVADAGKLIKEFEFTSGMNPYPGTMRGEAAFAIELAAAAIFSRPQPIQDAGRSLLQRFSRLIRPTFEPDEYEHVWLTAVLTLLQGRISPPLSEPFIERALVRFPNEPRFLLARAIVTDQLWRGFGTISFGDQMTAAEIPLKRAEAVIERYEAVAAASPELASEARIRLGWFLYRVGRVAEALRAFDAAPLMPQDTGMEYLRHLFKSHAFTSQGKLDDAVTEARLAHVIIPEAQSARVALMNALALRGDAAGAEAVADNIETAPKTADPWWSYWLGDFRWYGAAREALRGMIK